MPFGLTNAPATFQRLMERVLAGLRKNDNIVYVYKANLPLQTFEDHLQQLSTVLYRLKESGHKLKQKKCFLYQTSVKYLGHIVSRDGISTDPDKTKAVNDWPHPTT